MSSRSQAIRSIHAANNHLGGANLSRKQRNSACRRFVEWCYNNGHPIPSMKDATFRQVQGYFLELGLQPDPLQDRSDFEELFFAEKERKPLSIATFHNILGAIRRSMKVLKGNPDKAGITADALGLTQKSRHGKKLPVTDEVFLRAIDEANAASDVGFALCLKVERYFGHRGLEAIMSPNELKKYALDVAENIRLSATLISGRGAIELPNLTVRDGTKGGRLRQTAFIEKYARESLEVIGEVMAYLTKNERLIEGTVKGLKSAKAKYFALARKFGLTGQFSPHSLRYRYAIDKLCEMRDAGISLEDALVLCAKFLGHGPTRGLFVRKVYGQSVVHTFPVTRQRRDFASAQAEIAAVLEHYFSVEDDSSVNLHQLNSVPGSLLCQEPVAPDSQ